MRAAEDKGTCKDGDASIVCLSPELMMMIMIIVKITIRIKIRENEQSNDPTSTQHMIKDEKNTKWKENSL